MTNVILLFYASLFAAILWVLAALVNRWDEDHQKLKDISEKVDELTTRMKGLEEDLDDLYQHFYKLRDFAELTKSEVNTAAENNEAAANAILNMRNDISKLSIRLNKLEGKETK